MKRLLSVWAAACLAQAAAVHAHSADQITTGPENGTYVAIGRDLARLVTESAGVQLDVLSSRGSSENVQRLRNDADVRLALVQSDVYQAFLDQAAEGNAEAAELVAPLRVVMPLYLEEIYFVTRADSPMTRIDDIKDKRINIGPLGSGTALSATTVYRQVFGTGIAEKNASFLGNEEALRKLVDDKSIDVVVIVAGQPATIFANMRPQARRFIKLLRLDPDSPARRATASTYGVSTIRTSSYPAWMTSDIDTLSTRAMLVTRDNQLPAARQKLVRIATALCENLEVLRAQGHAKWQEVQIALPALAQGWRYYQPTEAALSRCRPRAALRPSNPAGPLPKSGLERRPSPYPARQLAGNVRHD